MRRFLLLLLAMGWGYLAYGASRHFGYHRAEGYPPLSENLLWAGVAALPLIIGVLVAPARTGFGVLLRWICAAALGMQTGFFLIFSWLHIYGLLPLLGVVLLLWPEISGQPLSPPEAAPLSDDEKARRNKKRLQYGLLGTAGLAAFIWWGWFHNPLPSDEEMIEHLNEHRAEFEQLVEGYRNYRRPEGAGPYFYEQSEEVQALMRRAKVSHLGSAELWLPDPYSERTVKFNWDRTTRSADPEVRPLLDGPKDWKREWPELFVGVPPITDLAQVGGRITMWYGNPTSIRRFVLRYGEISKGFFHYPQPPRVENGWLLAPKCYLPDCPGLDRVSQILPDRYVIDGRLVTQKEDRVFDSLNNYPANWERGECVLRRIDPNWFLMMCRAA